MNRLTRAAIDFTSADGAPDVDPQAPAELQSKVDLILGLVMYAAIIAAVVGFLVCAIRMAMAWRNGELGEKIGSLGGPAVACLVIASAASMVNFLVL